MKKQISNLFTKATTQPPTSVADRFLIGCSSVADRFLTMTSLCHYLVLRTLSLRTLRVAATLTLLLCLGVGQMWGTSPYEYTVTSYSGSTGTVKVTDGTVRLTMNVQSKTYNNTGSTKVSYVSGTNYLVVSAATACIDSIELTGNTDDNSKTVQLTYQTSADSSTWATAQTMSGTFAHRKTTPTTNKVTFGSRVKFVRFVKSSSSYVSVGKVKVYYTSGGSTYTLTNTVNEAGYGTVSPTSVASIPSGMETSSSSNTYTVNGTTVTATPAASTSAWTYAFSNWSGLPNSVTANATVTANFNRTGQSYTIALDNQSATTAGQASVTATYGSAMPSIAANLPAKTSYDFYGYFTSTAGGGTKYYTSAGASAANSTFTAASTLYAAWQCKSPTISFSNDATNTVTITNNTASATVYYTTDGSTPTSSSTAYSAPFTIDADKTIKAIAIQSGCVNSSVASLACAYQNACSSPQNPTNETTAEEARGQVSFEQGDSESEWEIYVSTTNSAPSSGTAGTYTGITDMDSYQMNDLTGGTTYYWWVRAVCDEDDKSAWTSGGSLTANYKVTYNGNDNDSGSAPAAEYKTPSTTYTVLGNTGLLVKAYNDNPATFYGWNTNSDMNSGTSYAAAATFSISSDVTLYARWGYPISYSLGSGSWASSAPQAYYIYNIAHALPSSSALTPPSGQVFDHWEISSSTVTSIAAGTVGAKTVTAVWRTPTYNVTYAGNGSTGGTVPTDDTNYTSGQTVTVAAGVPTKSGSTFVGWLNSTNNTIYRAGQSFTITAATTLTAQWSTPTVTTYYYGGVSISNGALVRGTTSSVQFFTYANSTFANSTAITLSSTPSTTGIYSNTNSVSSWLTTSNWTTSSSSNRYIQGVDFVKDGSYTLALGSNVATSIRFIGFSNQSSTRTMTVGGVGYSTSEQNTIYSHEYTKSGNFTGNVTITQDGSFRGILIITTSTPSGYNVTFNASGKSATGMPSNYSGVPSGKKIAEPAEIPTVSGYIFDGWVTTSGGSTAFDFANTTIIADKTIYASWVAKTAPTQYTLSGDSYYCPSGTATLTLSGSQSGISYQLLKGGVAEGDPVDGTGDALEWEVDAAGTYTVKAVENATYSERTMSGSVTVSAAATTDISTQPTPAVSAGASVNFTLGSDMVTAGHGLGYQWYSYTSSGGAGEAAVDGAESATYTTSKSVGTYYYKVKVSGDCGDPVYSNMITVTVKNIPTVYTVSGTTSICSGETATITLADSEDGIEYQLLKGGVAEGDPVDGTGDALEWEVSAAGTYTVKTVETSTYAEATMSSSAVITIKTATAISTQPTTSVSGHDGVNFTVGSGMSATGQGTLTYKWYSYTSSGGAGETEVGATTATYTTSKSAGTYYYKVEVTGDCGSVKSNMITVTIDNKHLLSYNANGGSGVPGSSYIAAGSTTLNSSTIPTRSGYVFLGWNTNNGGTGNMYQPGATYTMPSTATTLYAAWASEDFKFIKGTTKSSEPGDGVTITSSNITTYWSAGATLSGGTIKNTSGATLGINGTYGFVMIKSTRSISVSLSSGAFQAGTVIYLEGYSNNANSKTHGFSVGSNAATPLYTTTSTAYTAFTQRYVVTAGDGIAGTSSFTLTFNSSATGAQAYLSLIAIGNCLSCTTISPTLTYSATTLYAFGGTPNTATPTLNKDGNTGAVTWTSSNTDAVTVDASGNITAVGAGTATISAELPYDGTHCGGIASCDITVPALVTQTINLNAAWTTVPDMTFNDPTSTLTKNANIAATGYTINESDNKSGLSSKITGVPSSTSKDNSYYMSLKFNSPSHNVRFGKVIVPIQPITNTASAIATLSDGTTTITSNEVADIAAGSPTNATFTFTTTTLKAGTIELRIYVYDQTGDKGFRLGSPITISGAVLTDYYATATGNWSSTSTWEYGALPLADDNAILQKPVTVDNTSAVAKNIVIDKSGTNTGKLTIAADGMLIASGTIRANGDTQTAVEDVVINCTKTSQGALIFDNPSGELQTKGTVNMYTRSYRDGTTKKLQWQYVGVPFDDVTDEVYGGLYVNKYSETAGSWTVMRYQDDRSISAWDGLALAGDEEGYASMQGTFTATDDKEITLTNTAGKGGGENLIGNSWTAPIQIADLEATDFGDATATVYIFNTGRYKASEGSGSTDTEGTTGHTVGQWMTIPIASAASGEWEGMKVIPAFQGFEVNTSAETTLSLDYSKVVASVTNAQNAELHAPARRTNTNGVDGYRIRVSDEQTRTDMYLFEHNSFSEGFDNGWDGDYLPCDGRSAQLYAHTALGKLAVAALPDLEGTVLGFKPGQSTVYTFSFGKTAGNYYLNDLKMQESTLIQEGNTYTFNWENGDSTNRFIISASPYKMPTGVEEMENGKWKMENAKKVLIDDHLYIIRAGKVFNATGNRVK